MLPAGMADNFLESRHLLRFALLGEPAMAPARLQFRSFACFLRAPQADFAATVAAETCRDHAAMIGQNADRQNTIPVRLNAAEVVTGA